MWFRRTGSALWLSYEELDHVSVIQRVLDKRLTQPEAPEAARTSTHPHPL